MSEHDDPRLESGLAELLGGEQPPDLRAAVRARLRLPDAAEPKTGDTPMARSDAWATAWATAALILVAAAVVFALAWSNRGASPTQATPQADRQPDPPRRYARNIDELRALPDGTLALSVRGIQPGDLAELARFRELRDIDLTAAIADEDLAALQPLAKLERLSLYQCAHIRGVGLAALEALPNLRTVDLSQTLVDAEGIAALAALPALTELTMVRCERLDDAAMRAVAALSALRTLDLRSNIGISRRGFQALTALRELRVLRVADHAGVNQQGSMPRPGDADGKGVDDEVFAALAALPELRALDVGRCFTLTAAAPPALAAARHLVELDITALSPLLPGLVAHAPRSLRALGLASTSVDAAALTKLADRLPDLERLDLDYAWTRASMPVEDLATGLEMRDGGSGSPAHFMNALGAFRALRELGLQGPESLPGLPAALAALPELEVLDLSQRQGITVEVLDALAALPRLAELRLTAVEDLDDARLARLAAAPALRVLAIGGPNRVTRVGLEALAPLRLRRLDLERTVWTDPRRTGASPDLDIDEVLALAAQLWPGCRVVAGDGRMLDAGH
jgi:hypothetical protein